MHIIVTFKEVPTGLMKIAHSWIVATGGSDRFSLEVGTTRIDFPQGCTYSDKLKRNLCKLLGDDNAVTVINEPMRQLSLIEIEPTTNYE